MSAAADGRSSVRSSRGGSPRSARRPKSSRTTTSRSRPWLNGSAGAGRHARQLRPCPGAGIHSGFKPNGVSRMKFKSIALAIALSACMGTAAAQQPAQPQQHAPQQAPQQQAAQSQQLTQEQQAQLARQDAELTSAATQVVQMIDANRLADVWDLSTDVVKRIVPRDSFV